MIETDKYKIYSKNNEIYLLIKNRDMSIPIDMLLSSMVDVFDDVVTETQIASVYEYQD